MPPVGIVYITIPFVHARACACVCGGVGVWVGVTPPFQPGCPWDVVAQVPLGAPSGGGSDPVMTYRRPAMGCVRGTDGSVLAVLGFELSRAEGAGDTPPILKRASRVLR